MNIKSVLSIFTLLFAYLAFVLAFIFKATQNITFYCSRFVGKIQSARHHNKQNANITWHLVSSDHNIPDLPV
nr:non-structural protein NS7 [Betacoronavirus sp.]